MFNIYRKQWNQIFFIFLVLCSFRANAQIIISQYYEGAGTNKWIELTNLGASAVNTASPQLKLGLWSISGSTGNINIANAPNQIVNLTVNIPARGSVLIGNTSNGTEVSYLNAASAAQTSNLVINFNGNDGVALLDASNNILDQFGQGINAQDISYTRNISVAAASFNYNAAEWTSASLASVNAALFGNYTRLGYHLSTACASPVAQASALNFATVTASAISGSFTATASAYEYLVVQSSSASLSASPVDGTVYAVGNALGGGTVIGLSNATSFSSAGLTPSTDYFYFIFSVSSNCIGGPLYLTSNPLTGSQATATNNCAAPAAQPTSLSFGNTTATSIEGLFIATAADEYLVVMNTTNSLSSTPVDGIVYNAGNSLGGGTVLSRNASNGFSATGLNVSTTYFFFIFSINSNCIGGPKYLTVAPLNANKTTNAVSSGALNIYFGNLHSHSSHSDGNADDVSKVPSDDYAFAKTSMCMDFLGISDHNHVAAGMQLAYWKPGRIQAAAATSAAFVGMYGMEWGVISGGGHTIVYGMDSLMGWDAGQYEVLVPKSVYTGPGGLFNILNRHGGNAFAYMAHPNLGDYNNLDGSGYDVSADEAIVGAAVESGPAFSLNSTYTNPGSAMSYLWYYNLMLAKGYHLGPTIDHDNHNMTFGKTAKTRLAILASALSENDLLDGMRRMRFYASEDCNARINFTIASQPMGSILTYPGAPVITVSSTTTAPVASIKIMAGVPGSGTVATELANTAGNTFSYTDNALTNLSQQYYYLDITETDGTRIITSPIWYSRNDAIVVASPIVTSFFAVNEKDRVVLKWTTKQEEFYEFFSIERSIDFGRTYTSIGTVAGKGFGSNQVNTYALSDVQPYAGVAYYRLLQRSADGEVNISSIKIVDRGTKSETYFTPYPNPAHGMLTINMVAAAAEKTMIELFDMAGRRVAAQNVLIKKGFQQIPFNMAGLTNGTYVLKINAAAKILSQLVNKF